jgi:transposase
VDTDEPVGLEVAMRKKRRTFTKQFKEEAVRLLESDSRSIEQVAQEIGVPQSALYRWRNELRGSAKAVDATDSEALSPTEKAELVRLRKEVHRLRMERDILKKAAAFFAKNED